MKSIIISDLDLTLTRTSLMYELSAHHIERGIIPRTVREERLAIHKRYDQGLIGYGQASLEALAFWVNSLKGRNQVDLVADAADYFIANCGIFYPFFPIMRETYRSSHDFYLVTANLDFVAAAVCEVFGLDGYAATLVGAAGGVYDGTIKSSLLGADEKGAEAEKILRRYDAAGSIGLGDTENDAVMLEQVAYPICVNASPGLRALAVSKGWRLANPEGVLDAASFK